MSKREISCEIGAIAGHLATLPSPIERIGFEAGLLNQNMFSEMSAEGFDVVSMEAPQVNAVPSAMRNETNGNDARGIAQILR